MDVHHFSRMLQTVAGGSALLLIASAGVAGHLCREPSRPHVSAADAANWGYHQTCWQKFPPVPPCHSELNCWTSGDQEVVVPSHPDFYVPQHPESTFPNAMEPAQPFVPPSHSGTIQGFSEVPRYSAPPAMNLPPRPLPYPMHDRSTFEQSPVEPAPSTGPLPVMPSEPLSGTPERTNPGPAPSTAPVQTFQAPSLALPPLPPPPEGANEVPDQSGVLRNRVATGADRRMAESSGADSIRLPSSSRYGRTEAPLTATEALRRQAALPKASPGVPLYGTSVTTAAGFTPNAGASRYGIPSGGYGTHSPVMAPVPQNSSIQSASAGASAPAAFQGVTARYGMPSTRPDPASQYASLGGTNPQRSQPQSGYGMRPVSAPAHTSASRYGGQSSTMNGAVVPPTSQYQGTSIRSISQSSVGGTDSGARYGASSTAPGARLGHQSLIAPEPLRSTPPMGR